MDNESAARMAIAAFFMALKAGVGIHKALADLYEAGVDAGAQGILADPGAHGLVGLPA